jgi:hypothetical protein
VDPPVGWGEPKRIYALLGGKAQDSVSLYLRCTNLMWFTKEPQAVFCPHRFCFSRLVPLASCSPLGASALLVNKRSTGWNPFPL